MITKKELTTIVETCWATACEANLGESPQMFDPRFQPPVGCNGIRVQLFFALVGNLVPKQMNGNTTMKMDEPKEPWQE